MYKVAFILAYTFRRCHYVGNGNFMQQRLQETSIPIRSIGEWFGVGGEKRPMKSRYVLKETQTI
jgi:hypothetical protein